MRLQHSQLADAALASSLAHSSVCKNFTFPGTFTRHVSGSWILNIPSLCPTLQAYLKHCLRYILDHCSEDLEFFAQQNDKMLVQRIQVCIQVRASAKASHIGKLGLPCLAFPSLPFPLPFPLPLSLPLPSLPLPSPPLPSPPLPSLPFPSLPFSDLWSLTLRSTGNK